VNKKLEMLEALQTIDSSVDQKQHEQAVLQAGIAELEQTFATLQERLAAQLAAIAELRKGKADIEAALHSEHENIKRSETNMKEIRTNKEYQAVGREIAAARKQVSELEEQLLQLDSKTDELQKDADTLQAECSTSEESAQAGKAEKQAAIDALQKDIDAISANRAEIVKTLGSSLIRRYTQLREQRRGQALAEARDGSCTGCNMQLPPQLFNSLFKNDEMYFCPHCQRILILKQQQAAE